MTKFLFYHTHCITRINTPKIMDNKIVSCILFTLLLFTVSAARPAVDPPVTNLSTDRSEDASKVATISRESVASAGSHLRLPGDKVKSDSDETTANNRATETEKPTNDLTPRTNFSRFHPINNPPQRPRQIRKHRRPFRKHSQYRMPLPRPDISGRKDEITAGKPDNSRSETFRGEVPSNWLKMKHHYARRNRNNNRNNNENVIKPKHVDREKLKSLIRQQKQKREEEAGLMKNIRKFLKHTSD